jgi:hypothetical protein
MNTFLASAASACLFALVAPAQLAGPGLTWQGSQSQYAGSFLPSCQNQPVTVLSPETITIKVWGDMMSPFGLFASASGSQCIPIPGFGGFVILDFPVVPITAGLLTEVTPCLSCPPGLLTLQFAIPPNLPPGTSLALQGIALGNGQLGFTIAITGTV